MSLGYEEFLEEQGMTEEVVQQHTNTPNVLSDYFGSYELKDSPINGIGVFATKSFKKGDNIAWTALAGMYRTHLGRYVNHNDKNNAISVLTDNGCSMAVATKAIKKGDEIFFNYRDTTVESRVQTKPMSELFKTKKEK